MIIAEGGYSLLYERNKNRIIIGLPQTQTTVTNTVSGVVNRRDRYEDELTTLLFITKLLFEEPETIKAEPVRHGKWIWDDEGYHCSECWYHAQGNTMECMDGTFEYCPVCGAVMDFDEVEE